MILFVLADRPCFEPGARPKPLGVGRIDSFWTPFGRCDRDKRPATPSASCPVRRRGSAPTFELDELSSMTRSDLPMTTTTTAPECFDGPGAPECFDGPGGPEATATATETATDTETETDGEVE